MGSVVSAIGGILTAIVRGIADVILTILNSIITIIVMIFDLIMDILCCRCCTSRRRVGTRRGFSTRSRARY